MPYKPPPAEPIAVVASSCRFAGEATSPSKLWELLLQPTDVARVVPASRFNARAFTHPDGDYHGTTDAPIAYWLDDGQDGRAFDAGFFGIAPKEAEAVDPQQRLLLEAVYEAMESAGYQLPQWAGQDVAVYVGAMTSDFDCISQRDDLTTSPYYATGNARSILANRISYFYDFRGPSATIDTACSSSLVALHQAVRSLRAGDCQAACVAGVNLMLAPDQFVVESSLHMLSPTGHCRMWDAAADGYARGEGVAVLLLKPLSRALADGDAGRIQAIVRETGVGSDGRTAGITMPSPEAQADLIRAVYRRAGLDLADPDDRCQYFEAHGTGTPVGDPREAAAIHTAFFGDKNNTKAKGTDNQQLLVGSVKTVIGHTEGAAGLAGILKVMLAMKHAQVPPNLHMERLNPEVAPFCTPSPSAAAGYLRVPTAPTAWPAVPEGQPLRASVNSFGFGGTNAHCIVERFDPGIHAAGASSLPTEAQPEGVLPPIPVLLSANSASTLRVLVGKYKDYLEHLEHSKSNTTLETVAWCTYASRTPFLHRFALSASTRADAIHQIADALASDETKFGSRARRVESAEPKQTGPKLLGIFTGQAAQWPGMSKRLLVTSHIYRDTIRHLDDVLRASPNPPDWTLEEELQKSGADGSRVHEPAVGQPLCTALQIGLVDMLRDGLGVRFSCVVGHSSGEIAAAYAAGRLSARDAILIAYHRGKSVATSDDQPEVRGGMMAVGLSIHDAEEFCQPFSGRLGVAASNSPSSTTLSGDLDAITEAEQQLQDRGVFARRLSVKTAYHSHHMVPLAGPYAQLLEQSRVSPVGAMQADTADTAAWVSSVRPNGPAPATHELASPYWVDNMVKPVLFHEAVEKALSLFQDDTFDCAIEVGPHSTLKGPVANTARQIAPFNASKELLYTSVLQRGKPDDLAFSQFLGFLWTKFDPVPIDLWGLIEDAKHRALSLSQASDSDGSSIPAYPWDHSQVYYRESRIARQFHHRTDPPHELLGSRTRDDIDGCELRWRNLLRVDKLPWLVHHAFQRQPLLPASAYCIMALDAARAFLANAGRTASLVVLENLDFLSGIALEVDGPPTEIMFSLVVHNNNSSKPTDGGNNSQGSVLQASFSVFSGSETAETPMRKRCTGAMQIHLGLPTTNALPVRGDSAMQPETCGVDTNMFYEMMASLGLQYSGPFQALESMQRRHGFASAKLKRFHPEDTTSLSWSPATLDSSLQTCFAAFSSPGDRSLWTVFLPIRMKKVSFSMAHIETATGASQSTYLAAEAQLTDFQTPTRESPARQTGDICIYNTNGEMEIQVEGLTVGSLASTQPNADRELYLHTVYSLDPEDSLLLNTLLANDDNGPEKAYTRALDESCQRVLSFYMGAENANAEVKPLTPWPSDTEETIEQFILASPFCMALEKVRAYAKSFEVGGDDVQKLHDLPFEFVLEEGRHFYLFQEHISKTVKQVAHKYPRMSVFSLTDAEMCMSSPILKGLGSAFTAYTSLTLGPDQNIAQHLSEPSAAAAAKKVHVFALDGKLDVASQLANHQSAIMQQSPFDLVILSTSIFKHMASSEAVLDKVKKAMRPGGFLLLIHMPIKTAAGVEQQQLQRHIATGNRLASAIITPPDWPDLLDQHGFISPAIRNMDQHPFPGGFSVTARQSESGIKGMIRLSAQKLQSEAAQHLHNEKMLIVGTKTEVSDIQTLAARTYEALRPHFTHPVTMVSGLDGLAVADSSVLSSSTCVLMLADLDEFFPILSTLDEHRLDTLRKLLFRPDMTMLWVTNGARSWNPENAASYGFTRTIRSEMPSLILQMLDFDHLGTANDKAASVISDVFVRLMLGAKIKRTQDDGRPLNPATPDAKDTAEHLWVLEPEVYIDIMYNWHIPRVLPFQPGNKNFNASRRTVTKPVNTLTTIVEIQSAADGTSPLFWTKLGEDVEAAVRRVGAETSPESNTIRIRVFYSSMEPICSGMYVCIGQNETSGDIVAAVSPTNASFVSVPHDHIATIVKAGTASSPGNESTLITGYFANALICTLICNLLSQKAGEKTWLLLDPDTLFLRCAKRVAESQHRKVVSIRIQDPTNPTMEDNKGAVADVSIHPRATVAQIKSTLYQFQEDVLVVDLLPHHDHGLAAFLSYPVAPSNYEFCSLQSGLKSTTVLGFDMEPLQQAIDLLKEDGSVFRSQHGTVHDLALISIPALIDLQAKPSNPLQILDWRAERTIQHTVKFRDDESSTRGKTLLRGDRTYVLVGITRDMGQSLSVLLVKQGARHIVLASRNPPTHKPQWAQHLGRTCGAEVRFEALDVTDVVAVRTFRETVERSMPRVGGVVNGAMVLDDRIFAHMTADTFMRVMRPKTVGSRNLADVFQDYNESDDDKLDFFIMTSSFAAIGGHAGQSNYASANMYMNGIAAERQRRGVAGSVLNIGVIYGLGFLHREKDELYAGLEREGYPPISERDLHHMFLEAIVRGQPQPSKPVSERCAPDLTTGLNRFSPQQPPEDALHWHTDPRFSHFTVDSDEGAGKETTAADGSGGGKTSGSSATQVLADLIRQGTATAEAVAQALSVALCERLTSLLHMGPRSSNGGDGGGGAGIRSDSSLVELGVDSLVAVETRTWLWRATGRNVPVMRILGAASIDKLCMDVAKEVVADRK